MRTIPLLLVALGALVLPASGQAAGLKEAKYDVTFELTMTEKWKAETRVDSECGVDDAIGRCLEDIVGSGQAKLSLRTPTPQRVSVTTGPGMKPMVVHNIDSGIPIRGEYKRSGSYTDTYSGLWDAANPDQAMSTKDCGSHGVKTSVAFGWTGRSQVQTVIPLDLPLECPSGPHEGFDYKGDPPSLMDVLADVSPSKFRTKQFRFGGKRTWTGVFGPITRTDPRDLYSRSGDTETTYAWEATFRKVGKKKKRR